MQNPDENHTNYDQKSPEKSDTILTGSGISYAQIPRHLFKLTEIDSITYGDAFLALRMFDWCHQKRKFPRFKISHSDLAHITKMSRRAVMYGLDRLIDLQLIIARLDAGKVTEYQWNEYFLQTGFLNVPATSANSAHVPVQTLHITDANSAHVPVQTLHLIYIEFLLDYLSKLYLEYFASSKSLIKRIPPRRGQKGVAKDFATHLYITRKDAWKEAIEVAVKKGGYVRTYVALAGGFNIENVDYPKAYLRKLIWDESHQYESKKKSYLAKQGHLDSDDAFLRFLFERSNRGNEKTETETTTDELEVEITFMTGSESGGEEMYE